MLTGGFVRWCPALGSMLVPGTRYTQSVAGVGTCRVNLCVSVLVCQCVMCWRSL